jgi:hypothetical protein
MFSGNLCSELLALNLSAIANGGFAVVVILRSKGATFSANTAASDFVIMNSFSLNFKALLK